MALTTSVFAKSSRLIQERQPARLRQSVRDAIAKIETSRMPPLAKANECGAAFARQFPVVGYDFDRSLLHERIKAVGELRPATVQSLPSTFRKVRPRKKAALCFDHDLGEGFCLGFSLRTATIAEVSIAITPAIRPRHASRLR